MIGEASGLAPDRGLNILYRVTMNTLMNLTETDLTQNNYSSTQQVANTRLSANTPKGLLAGSIVKCGTTAGTVVAANGAAVEQPVGVVINNAVGYPFESSSGVASGKCPYLHGAGTVFATDLYETCKWAGAGAPISYTAGEPLYASVNGLLTNFKTEGGALHNETSTVIIGIVLIAPSASDPFMVVQMRI
jgi:hypothetical protein